MSQPQDLIIKNFWRPSFDTLYDTYFQELIASAVADRWQRIDLVTSILVAVTASSSAIAGWALWQREGWRTVWLLLAGVTTLLSIVHGTMTVPTRIKEQEELRQQFSKLRVDLETFRQELELNIANPDHTTAGSDQLYKDYLSLRNRYAEYTARARRDVANTEKHRGKIRLEVNERLKEAIRE